MTNQRLRNLTTGRLHTEMGHIYQDLEIITGEEGLMTHMLPRAMRKLKVLVACEYSGAVRDAFGALGHDAWSCDLLPSEKPGNHFENDVRDLLCMDWDMMVAHPPCTHLCVSGARWFKDKVKEQAEALDFVRELLNADKPDAPPGPVAVAAGQSAPLFGGHRGGGKKRLDGLPAGSPAAIAADKERDRLRAAEKRAAKKVTPLPPALPGVVAPTQNAAAPAAAGDPALSPAPAGAAPAAAAAPLFVPWGQKLLEKPARLVGKIIERWRSYSRAAQVKKLKLSPPVEKEVLERMQWREDVVNDFSVALADCATVELNKRRVPGAENSHWINLVMTGGELVNLEMANSAMIEKLILEDRVKPAPEASAKAG